jgi:predicted alpha/beta-hydrolase family hydrolase
VSCAKPSQGGRLLIFTTGYSISELPQLRQGLAAGIVHSGGDSAGMRRGQLVVEKLSMMVYRPSPSLSPAA